MSNPSDIFIVNKICSFQFKINPWKVVFKNLSLFWINIFEWGIWWRFWYHFDKTCIWSIFIFNISFSRIILNIAFSIPLPIVFERLVCGRFFVVFHPDIDSFSSCEQMGVFCLPGFRFVSLFIWYLMGFFRLSYVSLYFCLFGT